MTRLRSDTSLTGTLTAALAVTQDHRGFGKNLPDHHEIALAVHRDRQITRAHRGEESRLGLRAMGQAHHRHDARLDGVMGVADYQCRQILGDNYFRLAPVFAPDTVIRFDAVKRIPELIEFADAVDISNAVKWLKAAW